MLKARPEVSVLFLHLLQRDSVNMAEGECKKNQEVDIYRDTPLRLLGYANEVGEAFRALVHVNWVKLSYGVASAYVVSSSNRV